MESSLLEIQKLAWFLERSMEQLGLPSLDLRFQARKYGPYANRLQHLLDGLDGSYLHCDKRLAHASPFDVIWFEMRGQACEHVLQIGIRIVPVHDRLLVQGILRLRFEYSARNTAARIGQAWRKLARIGPENYPYQHDF